MPKDYDPPMHTTEHVLNQAMTRLVGTGRSFSSHLNPGKSKLDYHFTRDLTEEEATKVEAEVNRVLALNLPVTDEFVALDEAKKLVDTSKLPPEALANPDRIRLVRIGDYDVCPCIGAHVKSTAECGAFRLLSHSFTGPGTLRLRFRLG